MSSVEALVEVMLVLSRDRPWSVQPRGDGFSLEGRVAGPMDGRRHWQLEGGAGEILTNAENEVDAVRARGARPGSVELPDPAAVEPGGDLRARMPWPAECASTVDVGDASARYELRVGDGAAARWTQLGEAAWVATTVDGALARVVVETARLETERIDVRLGSQPYDATYHAGFLMVRWRSVESPASSHESLRENAWLTLNADGTPSELTVHGAEVGAPVPAASLGTVDELSLWQEWPCDVTASRWVEDGRKVVEVRFGAEEPDVWSRLDNDVTVGAGSTGKLLRLVLPGVVEDEGRPRMFVRRGRRPDPFAAIAEQGAPELTVYGLAGEEGVLAGTSGIPGALQSLSLRYGDEDAPPFLRVDSSRDPFANFGMLLVVELASLEAHANVPGDDLDAIMAEFQRLQPGEAELVSPVVEPVTILVDGQETPLDVMRRGEHWGGSARVGETSILVVASGGGPEGLELETVRDVAAAARRLRELTPMPGAELPADDELDAAAETIDGLIAALQRNAGAPDLGGLFTTRVASARGGDVRYGRLLGLHAMLRPIRSYSAGNDAAQRHDDGSVVVTFDVEHESGSSSGWTSYGSHNGGDAEPDPAAIRAGAPHTLVLWLVREGDAWRIDTDVLALLEKRLGTVDELVRPLSKQQR